MEFEFDENKRLANIERHGIDFIAAKILFDDQHLRMPAKTIDSETALASNRHDRRGLCDGCFHPARRGHPHHLHAEVKK